MDKGQKDKKNKLDKVLDIMFIVTIIFTVLMVVTFYIFQAIPDTLVTSFYMIVGAELACCGWVKNAKEKSRRAKKHENEEMEEEL